MRIINIDLSQDARCPQKVFGGNAREHNESKLIVKLPERILRDDISYYYFEFQTVLGEHIVSPNIYKSELLDGNKISVLLWEQLLPFAGDLNFCVNAVNLAEDNTITIKGKTSICVLQILKSPTGEDALIDVSSTKEDLQKAIDDGVNEVVKKISIVGQKTPNSGEIFSTYEGENANKALSEATAAFGSSTKAGGKGFKITSLSKIDDTTGTYTLISVTGLEVGMEYNVRLSFARYKCGKILSISGTTITVDGYPNIALSKKQDTAYDKNNYLTIVNRPDLGDIDVGFFTATFGENCIAQDRSSFVAGRENTVLGQYSAALGRGNTVGYAGFVAGRENTVLGDMSLAIGQGNFITKGNCFIALGYYLKSESGSYGKTIVGRFNDYSNEANQIFVVGNGRDSVNRSNAFEVLLDGSALLQKQGTDNKSIAQKQYVDSIANTKQDSLLLQSSSGTNYNYISSSAGKQNIFNNTWKIHNDNRDVEILRTDTLNSMGLRLQENQVVLSGGMSPAIAAPLVLRTDSKAISLNYGESLQLILDKDGISAKNNSNPYIPTVDENLTTKQYVDNAIATQVSSVYKAKGSIADISALPTPDKDHEGFVYNIESEFTTTDLFVEGAGKTYSAGTNVVIVNTTGTEYKYDVLAGMVDLSSYATKKYVDDAIGNITALFASLVDMSKTTQSDEPTNDTEIVNEPTVDEGGLS